MALGALTSTYAQVEKIKGDKNVTLKQTYIDAFSTIKVGEDFTIELIFNEKPSVEIETDNNLHDIIKFEVVDGVLSFSTTKKITYRKKLNIIVNYTSTLENFEISEQGEIRSLTSLDLNKATVKTTGSAKAYLNINTGSFRLTSSDKSRLKLNLTCEDINMVVSETSKLDAVVNTKTSQIDLYQRANVVIEGSSENATFRLDNQAVLDGKSFMTTHSQLVAESSSKIFVNSLEDIDITASGDSEIYLYNTPKITVQSFSGEAKLQKKELQ
ncbi:MAG: DUF2807 domain-containing protein [Bacteroidetes bacterium MedPE-SWsnd-G2]|nr:MAG: DUF2807 domain-containing protein [Bacteroidetes bacterium MedPE-SWsnd-G2]